MYVVLNYFGWTVLIRMIRGYQIQQQQVGMNGVCCVLQVVSESENIYFSAGMLVQQTSRSTVVVVHITLPGVKNPC